MANRFITKKDFEKYVEVMKNEKYDMLFEAARKATGLSEDQYLAIRIHYQEIFDIIKKYPNKDIVLNRV